MTDFQLTATASSCLGRTCLEWRADGELTAIDLRLVLERLARVDPEATALARDTPDGLQLPCASIS